MYYRTGDIVLIEVKNNIGCQKGGTRPAVITGNNKGNFFSSTIKVMPATKNTASNRLHIPTHAFFKADEVDGLVYDSIFEGESEIVINKFQILKKLGKLTEDQQTRIAVAMLYTCPIILKAFEAGTQYQKSFQEILAYS